MTIMKIFYWPEFWMHVEQSLKVSYLMFVQITGGSIHNKYDLIHNVFSIYRSVVDCHNIIAERCPNLASLTFIGDYSNNWHGDDPLVLDQEADRILDRREDWQPHTK